MSSCLLQPHDQSGHPSPSALVQWHLPGGSSDIRATRIRVPLGWPLNVQSWTDLLAFLCLEFLVETHIPPQIPHLDSNKPWIADTLAGAAVATLGRHTAQGVEMTQGHQERSFVYGCWTPSAATVEGLGVCPASTQAVASSSLPWSCDAGQWWTVSVLQPLLS